MNATATQFEIAPFDTAWEGLRDSWLALFARCRRPCVWYHPVFLDAAGELPAALRPGHLLAGYREGALVFGVPCWIRGVPPGLREIEFYAGAGFDHLAPLDATPDRSVSRDFYRSLGRRFGVHVVRVRGMDEDAVRCLDDTIGRNGTVFRRHAFRCPVMNLPESTEALPYALGRSFRKGLLRRLRRAAEQGLVSRSVPGSDKGRSCADALDTLFNLHERRSDAIGRRSTFSVEPWRGFHRAVCRGGDRLPGLVRFEELLKGDRVVATIYGFTAGGVFHDFQGGMSDELAELSLGNIVRYRAMERMIGEGIRTFDFLRGTEAYKFDWTDQCRHDELVLAGSAGGGRLGVNWLRLLRSVHREGRIRGLRQWMLGRD